MQWKYFDILLLSQLPYPSSVKHVRHVISKALWTSQKLGFTDKQTQANTGMKSQLWTEMLVYICLSGRKPDENISNKGCEPFFLCSLNPLTRCFDVTCFYTSTKSSGFEGKALCRSPKSIPRETAKLVFCILSESAAWLSFSWEMYTLYKQDNEIRCVSPAAIILGDFS